MAKRSNAAIPSYRRRRKSKRGPVVRVLAWIVRMHFGRYGGMGVRITYVILGLLPAALFVTGAIMWWKRVLRGWLTKN